MAEAMIEVNKLSKLYLSGALFKKSKPAVRALDDVSIRLEKGKILGIVGESGSGKTTLANVILKLTNATSGNVRINGIDIAHADRREMKQLRRSIAVVFQDPMANLNPRFTVAKSIMRPMIVQNVPRQEALRRAEEVMDMVKMDGQVFEFTLSEFNHDSMFLNLLQIQLMDVGILMNIDPLTNSTEFRRLLGKEGWEVGLASNSFAEISSILVGHLEQVKMAGLFSDEEYAKLDELFVKAQSCLDNGEAEGYYNEVLREIVGTGCYIPISTPAVIIVYDKDVYDGVYYRRDATKIWLNDCE